MRPVEHKAACISEVLFFTAYFWAGDEIKQLYGVVPKGIGEAILFGNFYTGKNDLNRETFRSFENMSPIEPS